MAIKDILSEFGIKSVGDATLQGNETAFSPVKSQSQIDKKLSQNMDDGGRSKLKKYQEDQEVKKMSKIAQDDANILGGNKTKDNNFDISQGSTEGGSKGQKLISASKITASAKKETSDIDDAYKRSSIANRAKKEKADIDDAYKRNSVAKNSIKKNIPLPVSAKNKNRKTDSDNKSKAKVVTPAMIKAKGFTTLRDYLNDEKGLKRRDGKSVVRTKDFQANDKKAQNNKKILETVKIAVNKSKTKDDTKDNKNGNPITKFIKKEIGKVKSDFGKAVDETKRNLSDKRYFINGVDSRKQTPKIDNYRKGGAVGKKSIMLKGRGGSFKGIR
jgi:hypothetical protein